MKLPTICFVLLVCSSQPVLAADGWQKLKWGMSSDQVKALYPDSLPIDADFGVKSCPSGNIGKWGVAYDTGGRRFNAMFCFDQSDKLQSVGLKLKPPLDAAALAMDLEKKYGVPETHEDDGGIVAMENWRDGGTIVQLVELRKPNWVYGAPKITFTTQSVSIIYAATVATSNDGL